MDSSEPFIVANGNYLRIIMCSSDTYDTLSTVNLDYGGTLYSLKLRTELAPSPPPPQLPSPPAARSPRPPSPPPAVVDDIPWLSVVRYRIPNQCIRVPTLGQIPERFRVTGIGSGQHIRIYVASYSNPPVRIMRNNQQVGSGSIFYLYDYFHMENVCTASSYGTSAIYDILYGTRQYRVEYITIDPPPPPSPPPPVAPGTYQEWRDDRQRCADSLGGMAEQTSSSCQDMLSKWSAWDNWLATQPALPPGQGYGGFPGRSAGNG